MALTKVHSRMVANSSVEVSDYGNDLTAIQAADADAAAAGSILQFSAGTYDLSANHTFASQVFMNGGVLSGAGVATFLQGFDAGSYFCLQCNVGEIKCDKLNVRWFGALGDNSGDTPSDTGVDISTASWNTWDNTNWKDGWEGNTSWSPYYSGATFNPPRAKPFENDDSWDYIGISRAMWFNQNTRGTTYIPSGIYKINFDVSNDRGTYRGLSIMRGMEQTITGDGPYETFITTSNDAAYFAANNVGVSNYYKLLSLYRVGGPPTNVKEMAFVGPTGYASGNQNLTMIYTPNINGVTLRDLWLSTGDYGVYALDNSGDSHITSITTEFLYRASVYTTSTATFNIDFCNFWASASVSGQNGIEAYGYIFVSDCRFNEFDGYACRADSGTFNSNYIQTSGTPNSVFFETDSVINGNRFSGTATGRMLAVIQDCSIVGNYFNQESKHPCISCGDNSASSATNIVITGNTFVKTDATAETQNYNIVSPESGVNQTNGATASMFIIGNTFQGRTLSTIGSATLKDNIIGGSYVA